MSTIAHLSARLRRAATVRTAMARESSLVLPLKPRLLDRETIRTRHGSRRPKKTYVDWIKSVTESEQEPPPDRLC